MRKSPHPGATQSRGSQVDPRSDSDQEGLPGSPLQAGTVDRVWLPTPLCKVAQNPVGGDTWLEWAKGSLRVAPVAKAERGFHQVAEKGTQGPAYSRQGGVFPAPHAALGYIFPFPTAKKWPQPCRCGLRVTWG